MIDNKDNINTIFYEAVFSKGIDNIISEKEKTDIVIKYLKYHKKNNVQQIADKTLCKYAYIRNVLRRKTDNNIK